MKLSSLLTVVVFLFSTAVRPIQQSKPQGSVEGLITRLRSNEPVSGARVTLRRQVERQPGTPPPTVPLAPNAPVFTDDKGRFLVPNLEDGVYNIDVRADGFVPRAYGQQSANGAGTPVTISGGQPKKDADVTLTPAATVSGRIRDTSERPVAGIPVQLLRYLYTFEGQRRYDSVGATLTNDRGEYRMYWVTPGRYYLLAGQPTSGENALARMALRPEPGTTENGNDVPAVLGYAFYPGVSEVGNARALDLQPGADLQAIDLALTRNPKTYTLRGKLVDSRTGQPPPRANILVVTQTPGFDGAGVRAPNDTSNYNGATGTIEVRGLLPGTYTVTATVLNPGAGGRGGPAAQSSAVTSVTISSEDVDGVVMSAAPAGSIPGRVRIEGSLDPGNTIDRLRVALTPVASGGVTPRAQLLSPAAVSADGTFTLMNITPGDYRIEVTSTPQRIAYAGGFTKEARFEGVDVLASPLHFSGTAANGLDLVVAGGGGKVSGTLTDARSLPVPSTSVVLIPDRARFRPDIFRSATTGPDGRFTFSAIPPGDYKVFAWESMEDYAYFDPQVLNQYETRGRAVHVTETSSEAIDLKIIQAEGK